MAQTVHLTQYADGLPAPLIAVGVPTFGAVSIQWHSHMMQLQTPLNRALRHLYLQGKEVGEARNEIVTQALAYQGPLGEQISHILFIDDDVLVPPHTVGQLLGHGRAIVGGLYYAKTPNPQPLLLGPTFSGTRTDWQPGELVECEAHGMGATLIAREVFEALEAPWFVTTRERREHAGTPVHFHQTEDVYFLQRAREAGFVPCVDTGLPCWHYSMTERVGYPLEAWKKFTGQVAA
jgi:hypothetical protein